MALHVDQALAHGDPDTVREALQHIANHPQKDKVWFTRPSDIYDHCAALPKGAMTPPPA